MLADQSGRSKRFSEDFLREFFSLISERLELGESVKIKGLGTFKLSRVEARKSVDVTTGQPMEISGHSKVVFLPSKELSEAVNAPFEAFTAIEISDDVDISQLDYNDEIELGETTDEPARLADPDLHNQVSPEDNKETEIESPDPKIEEAMGWEKPLHSEEPDKTLGTDQMSENYIENPDGDASDTEAPEALEEGFSEEEFSEEVEPRKRNRGKIALISLAAVLVALFATLCIWYFISADDFHRIININRIAFLSAKHPAAENLNTTEKDRKNEEVVISDANILPDADSLSITKESDVPTTPSDALIYDTISTTRYLTTMAREHYDNFNFWPYIYEENKAILGHPDRIRPGTPVVIPKLSKYGVDPKNDDDIEKAKKMGIEIYSRYGKKI